MGDTARSELAWEVKEALLPLRELVQPCPEELRQRILRGCAEAPEEEPS